MKIILSMRKTKFVISKMSHTYLAHLKKNEFNEWSEHILEEHLVQVAHLASEFASAFAASDWARLAGLWHDLGKYQQGFQYRIKVENGYAEEANGKPQKQPHTHAGVLLAKERQIPGWQFIAYLIAGHHTGLPDWSPAEGGKASLEFRLKANAEELEAARQNAEIPDCILNTPLPQSKPLGDIPGFALWVRMLFSYLVDADYLDTESFMSPQKTAQRAQYPELPELKEVFDAHMQNLSAKAANNSLNQKRAQILAQCRQRAFDPQGIFKLSVPTGGGKTLSSLAFALDHAHEHNLKRIIYVIPYTSIIEQTAEVFRGIFDGTLGEAVLEHHSNFDPDERKTNSTIENETQSSKNRLAAENWDAPLIVTTNVQFFESLFAARTSRCRKLHNIANSVVVLDEAQMLPREYLAPCLEVIQLLQQHYGVSFVLSTATQPDFGSSKTPFGKESFKGLAETTEIIEDVPALFDSLRRTVVQPLGDVWLEKFEWKDVAAQMLQHESVLCIVNTRNNARELYELLREQDADCLHLSGMQCGVHKSEIIAEIKKRLQARASGEEARPLRVVSTQLVEAGVDIDFPVVFRAMAGLDSIAQAAGRCNREGKLPKQGQVFVFCPPKPAPNGLLRQGEDTTKELLYILNKQLNKGEIDRIDLLEPKIQRRYFELLYEKGDRDEKRICEKQTKNIRDFDVPFRSIANAFSFIENDTQAVIVPFVPDGKAESPVDQWLAQLEYGMGPHRRIYRKLQRYAVNLYPYQIDKLQDESALTEQNDLLVLTNPNQYNTHLGLLTEAAYRDPDDLIF